jgi:hypothetical protein
MLYCADSDVTCSCHNGKPVCHATTTAVITVLCVYLWRYAPLHHDYAVLRVTTRNYA